MTALEQRVIHIVARAAMVPRGTVTRETRLAALDMDSLEQIECALAVEEAFEVELGEPQLWRFRTVGDVVDAVEQAVAASRPPA
jgi:nodulation protein F